MAHRTFNLTTSLDRVNFTESATCDVYAGWDVDGHDMQDGCGGVVERTSAAFGGIGESAGRMSCS